MKRADADKFYDSWEYISDHESGMSVLVAFKGGMMGYVYNVPFAANASDNFPKVELSEKSCIGMTRKHSTLLAVEILRSKIQYIHSFENLQKAHAFFPGWPKAQTELMGVNQ